MRAIRILSTGLAAALLVTALLAGTVMGDDDDDEIEMTGVVLSVNLPNSSFQFREFASNVIWSVILRRDSRIELKGEGKDKSRNYRLVAGDIVEVEGKLLPGRTVLTKKVKVLAHTSAVDVPAPVDRVPQTDRLAPAPGLTVPAIVKTIGVGAAVKAFAPALNTFINKLVQAKDPTTLQTTKVVPILSISIGVSAPGQAAIGAAQVSGPKASVDRVQAVAALDANYQGSFSIRALVPVDSLEPWKQVRRVPSVGVSAIIDLKL